MCIAFHLLLRSLPACLLCAFSLWAQDKPCPVVLPAEPTAAQTAYAAGRFSQAEDQYGLELAAKPQDETLSASLVKVWLREGEVGQAATLANKMIAEHPDSAVALTALAEVQLHQGQPWLTLDTLKRAEAADPCYARIYLVRSQALRIDSMYASQRAQIEKAHTIDPNDPDIRHAWLSTVSPAHEIEGIDESLKTMKDVDADTRKMAEHSIQSMMPLLFENNQTCQVLPSAASASFTLKPTLQDAKHIESYRLDVDLPKTKASLVVDTGASGLFLSRAVADRNELQAAAGDPPGTVRAQSVTVGPLEFHDCIVGVSDAPFPNNIDGYIGTDMFASYLVTVNYPAGKLNLEPLPPLPGIVPGDRIASPELRGYVPVYHRQQYLMVPALLNGKSKRLFILDSGMRYSAMTSDVAHSVSSTKVNFTNSVQTTSGSTLKIYRDSFDFQLADLTLSHREHILELDASTIDRNAGLEVAGLLGFDALQSLVLQLDYRDGLVRLTSADAEVNGGNAKGNLLASGASSQADCPPGPGDDLPLHAVMQAKVNGLLDSAHLKAGKEITVTLVNSWQFPECNLDVGSTLYGHVTASSHADSSDLAFVFDQAECNGHAKRAVSLTAVGVLGPPDQFVGLHGALPNEVKGGGRDISAATGNLGYAGEDLNLNPGGPPKTVHPGVVLGVPHTSLEPHGGPGCSARLTSTEHSVRLGVGSEFLLTMQSLPQ